MKIKDSLFFKSLILLKKKPKNLLFIFLFDILFFISLMITNFLFFNKIQDEAAFIALVDKIGIILSLLWVLLYFLILLLIHTIIKLFIINQISKVDKQILGFYKKNLVFFIISIMASFIFMIIIFNVLNFIFKEEVVKVLLIIIAIFLFSINYTFISISQFLATKKLTILQIIKKALNLTFNKFLFPPTVLATLAIISYLFRNIYQIQITALILTFLLILTNRAYFYLLTKNVRA